MWFVVSVFLRADHVRPGMSMCDLWQESLLLLQAEDQQSALRAGEDIGRAKQHEYFVAEPERHLVRWVFVKAERAYPLEGEIRHGLEVFSRFLRPSEAESLLRPFEQ